MKFLILKAAVHTQLTRLLATGNVFVTGTSKDLMSTTYLSSFPEGTDPIFRERTEHSCTCCNSYIRTVGNIVAVIDGKLETIWDIDIGGHYQVVADAMAALVRSNPISTVFLHSDTQVGTNKTPDKDTDIVWDHFFAHLPSKFVKPAKDIDAIKGEAVNNYNVLKRSIQEISQSAIIEVLALIDSNSIYRGNEHLNRVRELYRIKNEYGTAVNKEEFLWVTSSELGGASSFRNSVIGTLLVDLSEGVDTAAAVGSYESKVAPENYKRSSALISQADIGRAEATIEKLGLQDSLARRHAVVEDITINDVLFADRSSKVAMGVLSDLKPTKTKEVNIEEINDINIEDFLSDVVPKTESMELLVTNEHQANFMSLVAPINVGSPAITKWGNNFSWSYHGEIADSSMRKNVTAKGGNVEGVLRFSIQWNTPDRPYPDDLDAHCRAGTEHIYYSYKEGSNNSGKLDVDIMTPDGVAVENIIYTDTNRMPDGDYHLYVNNYASRTNPHGFTAEVAFGGKVFYFDHRNSMRGFENVPVATVNKKQNVFTLTKGNPVSAPTIEVYGVQSNEFHKVRLLMNSPNHWDCVKNPKGNKHWFFILDKCTNKEPVRGFYNEFLTDDLHNDRKVFEVLGSKLQVPFSDNQLSGLGFSESQDNTVVVKVRGKINKTFKIKFN